MQIKEKFEENTLVIELGGELMGGTATDEFRDVIDRAIASENVNVIIDMANVSWMNSSGLGMLISALTSLRSSGGDLILANLTDRLRRPIQITKLDTVLKEYGTVKAALKHFD
jgi:anti-sigma B factor antagonist